MGKSLVKKLAEKSRNHKIIAIAKDINDIEKEFSGSNIELYEAELQHEEDRGKRIFSIQQFITSKV
jgi:hypothetical protein